MFFVSFKMTHFSSRTLCAHWWLMCICVYAVTTFSQLMWWPLGLRCGVFFPLFEFPFLVVSCIVCVCVCVCISIELVDIIILAGWIGWIWWVKLQTLYFSFFFSLSPPLSSCRFLWLLFSKKSSSSSSNTLTTTKNWYFFSGFWCTCGEHTAELKIQMINARLQIKITKWFGFEWWWFGFLAISNIKKMNLKTLCCVFALFLFSRNQLLFFLFLFKWWIAGIKVKCQPYAIGVYYFVFFFFFSST